MYNIIKKAIIAVVGKKIARKIASIISHKKPLFSEADIIIKYFDKFLRKGVMIDVGVHFGESCLPYSERGWRIWGFEPDPNNKLKIPEIPNLRLFENAISDKDGEVVNFYGSDESSGISSLSAFRDSHTIIAQVETKTLRTFISEESIDHVDFLKIDIEGHDLFALKGFPFERIKPEIIICEFEDYKTIPLGYNYNDLGQFLISKGYSVYISEWKPITAYGIQHTWNNIRPFPAELGNEKAWGNFIAVREDRKIMFGEVLKSYLKDY